MRTAKNITFAVKYSGRTICRGVLGKSSRPGVATLVKNEDPYVLLEFFRNAKL